MALVSTRHEQTWNNKPCISNRLATNHRTRNISLHENSLRNLRPWKPGETGNVNGLAGHPKGIVNAKTVLTGRILTDLQEMWGALSVKEKVDWARKNMGQFMAIAAKLIPQD